MLIIDGTVEKELKKYRIPKNIYFNIYNALIEIDKTKKLDLFDIDSGLTLS